MAKYPFDKICEYCSAVFTVSKAYNRNQRYCSHKCASNASRTVTRYDNCLECSIAIRQDKYKIKFCSHSCAAIYHNRMRDPNINKKVGNKLKIKSQYRVFYRISREKIKELLNPNPTIVRSVKAISNASSTTNHTRSSNVVVKPSKPVRKVYTRSCSSCRSPLADNKKKYCSSCYPNIRHYRSLAGFKFNVYDYPAEFDINLIHTHGWFSPDGYKKRNNQPNLNGVSRDHLYTVSDGFTNKVDPDILAHPANCAILLHNGPGGNNSKRKSSITLNELITRIKLWDIKYPK